MRRQVASCLAVCSTAVCRFKSAVCNGASLARLISFRFVQFRSAFRAQRTSVQCRLVCLSICPSACLPVRLFVHGGADEASKLDLVGAASNLKLSRREAATSTSTSASTSTSTAVACARAADRRVACRFLFGFPFGFGFGFAGPFEQIRASRSKQRAPLRPKQFQYSRPSGLNSLTAAAAAGSFSGLAPLGGGKGSGSGSGRR